MSDSRVITTHADGTATTRHVKNLRWLLRRWTDVVSFRVVTRHVDADHPTRHMTGFCGPDVADAILVAQCRRNREYQCTWASRQVLADWLNRPVFQGVPVTWDGKPLTCGRALAARYGYKTTRVRSGSVSAIGDDDDTLKTLDATDTTTAGEER